MKGNQIAAKSAKHMANEHIDGISARLEGILEVEGAGDLIEPMLHLLGLQYTFQIGSYA